MRVTERTADNLVIEEGASTRIVGALAMMVIGAVGILIGWTKGEIGFLIIPPFFFLYGLKLLLFNRTETHRFERWRGMLAIDSKGLLGSKRRELPLDSIADRP